MGQRSGYLHIQGVHRGKLGVDTRATGTEAGPQVGQRGPMMVTLRTSCNCGWRGGGNPRPPTISLEGTGVGRGPSVAREGGGLGALGTVSSLGCLRPLALVRFAPPRFPRCE